MTGEMHAIQHYNSPQLLPNYRLQAPDSTRVSDHTTATIASATDSNSKQLFEGSPSPPRCFPHKGINTPLPRGHG